MPCRRRARRENYGRLDAWQWAEYDRVVYLDADCMVVGNLEPMFRMPRGLVGTVGARPVPHLTAWRSAGFVRRVRLNLRRGNKPFNLVRSLCFNFVNHVPGGGLCLGHRLCMAAAL